MFIMITSYQNLKIIIKIFIFIIQNYKMNKIQVSSSNIANYIIHTYVLIVLISWGSSSLFFLGSHLVLSSESFLG